MKHNILKKIAFGSLVVVMLMAEPMAAMAYNASSQTEIDNLVIPTVAGLAVKYINGSPYVFWGTQLTDAQQITVEWSVDPEFKKEVKKVTEGADENHVYLYGLEIGRTYYIRAKITEKIYLNSQAGEWQLNGYKESAYCPVISYTWIQAPDVEIAESTVTSKSVYFRMLNDNVTGYQIYRATGTGSFKKVATTSDTVYKDTNLKSNQAYRYRIRTYIYDAATGQTYYGKWKYLTKTTWGSDLKVKATPTGTKTIKVTWQKVTGATGYKIYRATGDNTDRTVSGGETSSFGNYRLIKTIKGSSTVSYTNKNLDTGMTYRYKVVAYREVTSGTTTKTLMISDEDTATLDFDFDVTNHIQNKDGSVTLKWKKSVGAEGFIVEKKNEQTGAWNVVDILAATTTEYTFARDAGTDSTQFRIYAYSGDNVSDSYPVTAISYKVETPGNVTAAATADLTGVTISWSEVPGAAYYKVFRSRVLGRYNADLDCYVNESGEEVYVQNGVNAITNYPVYTDEIRALSAVDTYLAYTETTQKDGVETTETIVGNKGPSQGICYYYYVQAYKSNGKKIDLDGNETETFSNSLFGKPAGIILNTVSLKRPTISKVTSTVKGQAVVTWSAVSGAQKYYVYYSTSKSSNYKYAGITTGKSYTVKNLTSGKKYYFKIKACRSNSVGADVYSTTSAYKSKTIK